MLAPQQWGAVHPHQCLLWERSRATVRAHHEGVDNAQPVLPVSLWPFGRAALMKILVSCSYFPPHIGGLEMVVQRQAESLAAVGHDVTVLTCRHDRSVPRRERSPKGYQIIRRPSLDFTESHGAPFPLISPGSLLRSLKDLGPYDAVHVHDMFYLSSHVAGLAAVLLRKPLFITQHVAIVDHPNPVVMAAQAAIYQTVGRFLYDRARRIVTYNPNVHAFVRSLGLPAERLLLTTNGIDTAYFAPASPQEKKALRARYGLPVTKPIVLFVGRLVHKKGFDLVFNARSDQYLTVIAGSGEVPAEMKSDARVVMFGPATQAQVRDLYRLSDLFVCPAVGEMLTLVMQEAMACGLPVITAQNEGYKAYSLRHDLISFVERRADVLRARALDILSNHALHQEMSEYSRRVAIDTFSWQKNYPNELAIYDGITPSDAGLKSPTVRAP